MTEIQKKIIPVLKKYGIRRAGVFGSVSRGEQIKASDVDILVSIGKPMGAFTYARIVRELEHATGKKVDVITDKSVNIFLKPYIMKDIQTVYEER